MQNLKKKTNPRLPKWNEKKNGLFKFDRESLGLNAVGKNRIYSVLCYMFEVSHNVVNAEIHLLLINFVLKVFQLRKFRLL